MYALLLVCLVVGFVSLTNAEDSLEVVKENAKFKGNFLYGGRGEKFKLACVAPADLPRKDRSNLIWFEKDRNVCGEKLCEAVEQKYKHSARVIEWTLKEDTVLTCAYIAEPTQWKNVSVHVFADSEFGNAIELNENATESHSLDLACNMNLNVDEHIEWVHDGVPIRKPERMTVLPNNGTLSFAKTYLVDSGVYFCRSTVDKTKRGSIIVVKGKAHIPERNTGSINRLQGDNLEIHCDVYGYPLPTVTWKRDNEDLTNASNRVFFDSYNGVPNASMKIINLEFDDKALYSCIASNNYGVGNATYLVRVKDKLAALWPFLGIVVEVAILVTIIFIYEKRRSKKEQDENSEDPVEQKKVFSAENDEKEVRQRKN